MTNQYLINQNRELKKTLAQNVRELKTPDLLQKLLLLSYNPESLAHINDFRSPLESILLHALTKGESK